VRFVRVEVSATRCFPLASGALDSRTANASDRKTLPAKTMEEVRERDITSIDVPAAIDEAA